MVRFLCMPAVRQVLTLLVVQIKANARALGDRLMSYGHKLVTDGTDNHLVLWILRDEVSLPCKLMSWSRCFMS